MRMMCTKDLLSSLMNDITKHVCVCVMAQVVGNLHQGNKTHTMRL